MQLFGLTVAFMLFLEAFTLWLRTTRLVLVGLGAMGRIARFGLEFFLEAVFGLIII